MKNQKYISPTRIALRDITDHFGKNESGIYADELNKHVGASYLHTSENVYLNKHIIREYNEHIRMR